MFRAAVARRSRCRADGSKRRSPAPARPPQVARVVFRLSALFALDAFAGGFVIQSLIAYWFHLRWGVEPALLGGDLLRRPTSSPRSRRWRRPGWRPGSGSINTMVFTHLPSNVLLILVPLMPNLPLAVVVLLARFSISQMDVPTRQSYTISVVDPDERSAAAGRDRHRADDGVGDLAAHRRAARRRWRPWRPCRSTSPAA